MAARARLLRDIMLLVATPPDLVTSLSQIIRRWLRLRVMRRYCTQLMIAPVWVTEYRRREEGDVAGQRVRK